MKKTWKRRFAIFASILAACYLAACGYLWAMQVELTFLPMATIESTPDKMGMEYEEVTIPVGTGSERGELHGFWVPADDQVAPAFLYLHGNDATIGKNLEHTKRLHELGYHVLLIDYRGFGKSFGTTRPSESKVYEDAEAAWNYLTTNLGFPPNRAFIYGHSLGGAIAIDLATKQSDAAGLITECTFTCVVDMSKIKYNGWLRLLPMDVLVNQRFDSIQKIGALKIPVLIIHGKLDPKVPVQMAEHLYNAAPEPKELLLIEGGGHADSGTVGELEYKKTVAAFVQNHIALAPEPSAPPTG